MATDESYAGDSYGAAFGPDGGLYTVASDGKLRRYGPGPAFEKKGEVATRGGRDAHSVAIDPRGQLLAVGFIDSTDVDVYDAATLRFRFAAHGERIDNFNLSEVAWSSNGARLVAGGVQPILIEDQWKDELLTFGREGRSSLGDKRP
jgi:hypothetical protein